MMPIVRTFLAFFATLVRSRTSLQLEIVALRHQLAVYQRSIRRPRIRPADRILWSVISRHWSRWRGVVVFVQPATVIAWQRKRFREHWTRISRQGTPGRPPISKDIRELIGKISAANPRWGSPRILANCKSSVSRSRSQRWRSIGCATANRRRPLGRHS